jgi:hypothetical protein
MSQNFKNVIPALKYEILFEREKTNYFIMLLSYAEYSRHFIPVT